MVRSGEESLPGFSVCGDSYAFHTPVGWFVSGGSVATMVPNKPNKVTARPRRARARSLWPLVSPELVGRSCLVILVARLCRQLNTVPVVNMLLGSVVGIGAAKAVLGHFSGQDIAQLFVAGPPVVSHAMGYDITKDLGGWRIHCTNGSVVNLAESEGDGTDAQVLSICHPVLMRRTGLDCSDDPTGKMGFTMIPRIRPAPLT